MSSSEDEVIEDDKPTYLIVELSQLKILLQHCHICGKIPGGRSKGKSRTINWTRNGTCFTAVTRCLCQKDNRIRWSTQKFVEGTETRSANLAITAAAQVAPIGYPDLASFFYALKMPFLSKMHFLRLSKHHVWPSVEFEYRKQQKEIVSGIANPIRIAIDGQYDSPGRRIWQEINQPICFCHL